MDNQDQEKKIKTKRKVDELARIRCACNCSSLVSSGEGGTWKDTICKMQKKKMQPLDAAALSLKPANITQAQV